MNSKQSNQSELDEALKDLGMLSAAPRSVKQQETVGPAEKAAAKVVMDEFAKKKSLKEIDQRVEKAQAKVMKQYHPRRTRRRGKHTKTPSIDEGVFFDGDEEDDEEDEYEEEKLEEIRELQREYEGSLRDLLRENAHGDDAFVESKVKQFNWTKMWTMLESTDQISPQDALLNTLLSS